MTKARRYARIVVPTALEVACSSTVSDKSGMSFPEVFPEFSPELVESMRAEIDRLVDDWVWVRKRPLSELPGGCSRRALLRAAARHLDRSESSAELSRGFVQSARCPPVHASAMNATV